MPIERPEPVAPVAICDLCNAKATFVEPEDEEVDESEDFVAPLGWVISSHSRRIANPDYAEDMKEAQTQVQEAFKAAMANAKQLGQEIDKAELKEMISDQILGAVDTEEYIEQELESVLCPDCSGCLQSRLCADEWDAEDE